MEGHILPVEICMTPPSSIIGNNIDSIFTENPIAFVEAYLKYLKPALSRIDYSKIGALLKLSVLL
jgi:hypothetical protein